MPYDKAPGEEKLAEVASSYEAPDGWDVVEHNFTDAQWHVVCDAYKEDDSTFLKMKLSEVYESSDRQRS